MGDTIMIFEPKQAKLSLALLYIPGVRIQLINILQVFQANSETGLIFN